MNADEYAELVAEIARLHVCENKPIYKIIAKTVVKLTPMAILANSMREPSEEELLDVVEQHNPFAVEDLSDELRTRYTAICKLHLDVKAAINVYREDRHHPASFRILESGRYLTWGEADPNCDSSDDDKMAEFDNKDAAGIAAQNYCFAMKSVRVSASAEVAAFNRYHERIQ